MEIKARGKSLQGEAEVSCVWRMVGWERRAQRTTGIWEHHPFQKQLRTCAARSVLPFPHGLFSSEPAQPKYHYVLNQVWAI